MGGGPYMETSPSIGKFRSELDSATDIYGRTTAGHTLMKPKGSMRDNSRTTLENSKIPLMTDSKTNSAVRKGLKPQSAYLDKNRISQSIRSSDAGDHVYKNTLNNKSKFRAQSAKIKTAFGLKNSQSLNQIYNFDNNLITNQSHLNTTSVLTSGPAVPQQPPMHDKSQTFIIEEEEDKGFDSGIEKEFERHE